ncbi:MAG: enoyl-CoA hydratase [Granulosicoccus sp.]|jgi:enoyl-CoA hydratase
MQFTKHDDVALLHFDDGKANAVSHDFVAQMQEGLDRAEAECKAVVIMGREGKFSAGFDLSEFQKGPEAAMSLVNSGGVMLNRIFTMDMPVVAASTGHAIAAGCFLLLACDVRIGFEGNFKIGANESAIGMGLPTFASELVEYRIPRNHIDAAVLQAKLYTPSEAVGVGFLDELVAQDQLQERAIAVAGHLAAYPGNGYAQNKKILRAEVAKRIAASLS